MNEWYIERLNRRHDRTEFSCGKPPLDEFIQRLVTQYEKRRLGRTYVATRPGDTKVYGYFTLAAGAVAFHTLPDRSARKLPKHPVPVVLLARLAVDQRAQGRRLGETLLLSALERCLGFADELGIHAVEVDAIDQHAKTFYAKYGFVPLIDRELHLFLPIDTVRDAFRPKGESTT